jgi:predicted GNAT family acetyltransferase
MKNLFETPEYAEDDPNNDRYHVTAEDRVDPTLKGLDDKQIGTAKTNNLFETPEYDEPDEPAPVEAPEEPGMLSKAAGYVGHLGYEGAKGLAGATYKFSGALATAVGAIPVLWDKAVSAQAKVLAQTAGDKPDPESTAAQDAWFKTMVDPALNKDEYFAPTQDFGSKAANALGGTLQTISMLVLTGGEAAPLQAANVGTGTVLRAATEHGVKAMTVPAISEAVNTGREVYQSTGDSQKAIEAASAKYLTTAASGVLPLSVPGGLAARAATGAVSGVATGELDRTTQNAIVPEQARKFSGEETALNAMTGAIMGTVMGPRGSAKPKAESPMSAIDEAQHDAAERAKAAGGDTLDQVLAAARAGAEVSEEFAGAHYEHSNQIARLQMADEEAAARQAEAEATQKAEEDKRTTMIDEIQRASAAEDDQAAVKAPRTADAPVYQPPTGRKLQYERGFDQAATEAAAKAPQEAAAKAKDYDEALVQREQQRAAEAPGLPAEPSKPLATLGDVARNLFEKPEYEPPPANLREARRLKRLETKTEPVKTPVTGEQKLLPAPEKTGRFIVDKEGAARPETGADVRARKPDIKADNLAIRRQRLEVTRDRNSTVEIDRRPREAVARQGEKYAEQLWHEVANGHENNGGGDGSTPPDVVADANRRAAEEAARIMKEEDDAAAREAAPHPENDRPEPTQAQYEAGNFKMGHTSVHDMPVTIEYPRGAKRPYTTAEGVKGEREMPDHYGYFKGTEGADGMHVDVLLGEHPASEKNYVVDHLGADGNFEQHKVLSGYRSQLEAVRAYKKAYPERKVGPIKEMSPSELKSWLKDGNTKKPLQPEKLGRAADRTEKTQARGSKLRYREGDIKTEQTDARQTNITLEGKRGDVAGELVLKRRGDSVQVINANVDESMQGVGHGVRMYEQAVQKAHAEGKPLVSDTSVSEHAARMYTALERRGHDVKRNPNVETEDSPRYGKVLRSTDSRPVFEVHKKTEPLREREADPDAPRGEPRTTDAINAREVHRVAVKKSIEAFNKELPGLEAKVHDSVADAPDHIRAKMEADGQTDARAVFDPDTGEVHIFADNHASAEDALVTAVHEGVAHKGLRHLLKEDFDAVMHDVFNNAVDKKWIADFLDQHGLSPKDKSNRVIAAEEYAASIAERMDADPTLWRKVVDAVRSALRKLKMVKKWTDADIQALLRKSRSGLQEAVPRLRETANNRLRYAENPDKLRVDDDHPLAMASRMGATVEEQANYNPGFVRSRVDALRSFGQNNLSMLLGAIPRDKLRDFVAPGKMPSTDAYTREVQKMDGRRNELMMEAEKTGKRWLKYNRKNRESAKTLSELMHAATIAGVEPANEYKPLYSSPKNLEQRTIEAQRKAQHSRLRKFWNQLDGEGKALYVDVRDSYVKDRDRVMTALETRINGAEAEGRTKVQLLNELRTQFEKGRVAGPYFPLARFGKHWAVARNDAGDVVSFTRFEKPTERDAWRTEMDKQGYKTDGGQKLTDDVAMAKALDPHFVAKITELLKEVDPSLSDDVWQHYLKTLPELSMRKHFIHRQGRLGFTGDALRAYGFQKFHGAHQIAKLEHMATLEGHLEQMTVEARKLEEARDKEAKWAVPIVEEFKQRHEWARNPKVSAMSRALTSLGYMYYMAASPATAFVNLTQTAGVALPVLSGEFNPVSATSELMKATAQWAGSRGDFGNRLRGDERKAFDEATSRGIYEKTQAHDLASIGNEGADFGSVRNQAMHVASFLFHHIERFNREATHIAAYRLARKAGQSHEAASEKAIQLTNDSHFDYSNANRPRYMQSSAARVLLLFRNYAVNMTYRLARDFRNGIIRAGKTPEERHGAFTRFAGMLGATMVQAGVTGLPMWWAAKKILNMVLGDEDTPFDAEAALYAHLTQQYGERAATTIMHGAVDANTPLTLSSRVGLNNLWIHDAPPNIEGRDEGLFYLQEAAGPVGGLVVKAAQAAALPSQGYADRALEQLTPKAAGDVLKAVRYAREGVSDLQGHTLIPPEEVTNQDLFAQAIGFTPSHVARVQEQNRNIKAAVGKLGDRRQQLVNRLFMAAHADDPQGITEAMDEIRTFNEKNPRVAIRGANIVSSAKARARYSQQSIDGLRVEPNMRYLQDELRIRDEKESE